MRRVEENDDAGALPSLGFSVCGLSVVHALVRWWHVTRCQAVYQKNVTARIYKLGMREHE